MTHDFLIIGGGIAGISAAARLAPLGSVLLLEAETNLAYHASARSAALYEPRYGNPAVVALSLASDAEFQASGTLSPRGLMIVDAPDQQARFEAHAEAFELTPLSIPEAQALFPILNPETVGFAAHAPHAWDIDTDLLIQTYLREARAHGAEIRSGAPVTQITRQPQRWEVIAGGEAHQARIVFNAAGAWADPIAELAGIAPKGVQPLRRSMARLPAPGGRDTSHWPMVIGGNEDWYCKPDAGALIVSPAEEDLTEPHDAWADDMVLAEGLARYEEMVTEPVTRLLASWAGLRSFAPDRAPLLGPDPADPTFYWIAGQGGYGFQTCPAASALIADLVAGRPGDLPPETRHAVAPSRFG
ncbi:NAD(P)/FAD-dependent oxidoreductase [Pseudothioclava arenosa]|uniref:Glycerol-3-phosphate dehydrogenase n=1 Tax=Pseudothioclava arenosa TaxID=1795308 RepID=A0A2A4CPV5_9RHOB|nr:FAD-binding oxidoreductase [Pseudothioclava arenosa]PCD76156.1 glycerol-3-phosphate dehydrogenase [Pseudothioclava arenosa]